MELEDRAGRLSAWIRQRVPDAEYIEVSAMRPASSGSSNSTFLFRLQSKTGGTALSEELVIRWSPPGKSMFPDQDLQREFEIMRALADSPVPVPRVRWYEPDPGVMGAPFLVMEHIQGEVPSDHPPGLHGHGLFFEASVAQRTAMWWAALDQLASLHRIDWRSLALPRSLGTPTDGAEALQRQISQLDTWLRWAAADLPPVIPRAFEWLRSNLIAPRSISLLWGDARPGNIIYRGSQVAAVLDWELASLGPPELDLAYFLLVSDTTAEINNVPRLEGIPGTAETVARYEALSGRAVSNYRYAEIFAALRMAIMIALIVRVSPPNLKWPPELLTENTPTRRLTALLADMAM